MEENILQKTVSNKFKKFRDELEDYLWGDLLTNVSMLILPLELQLHSIFDTKNLDNLMGILKSKEKSGKIWKEYVKDLKEEKKRELGLI